MKIISTLFDSLPNTPKNNVVRTPVSAKRGFQSRKDSPRFGSGFLPKYKTARRHIHQMDYVYWDDPNELVDRLRLLIAEQGAGNMSHTNEIHAIVEELKEAGYIY